MITFYWILATLVMLIFLVDGIYTLISSIKLDIDHKKYMKKQEEYFKKYYKNESEDK